MGSNYLGKCNNRIRYGKIDLHGDSRWWKGNDAYLWFQCSFNLGFTNDLCDFDIFDLKLNFFFIDMGYCFVNCQFICLFYVKIYLFVFKLTRSSWNIEKYEFKNHIKPDLINQEWYQNLIELVRNTVYVHNSINKFK